MKCDTCKFQKHAPPDMAYPHLMTYCAKGHWDGLGEHDPSDPDPWQYCGDYEAAPVIALSNPARMIKVTPK